MTVGRVSGAGKDGGKGGGGSGDVTFFKTIALFPLGLMA